MPEDWSRRTLLASLPTATLAGCSASNPDGGADDTPTTPGDATPTEPRPSAPEHIDADWPMPAHDAGRSNYSPVASGPTDRVAELWTTAVDASLSGPVLADETLYVGGDDGTVRAVDAATGEERWQRPVGAPADTPWVHGDRLFVPTAEGIVALGVRDGTEAWRADTPGRVAVLVASHGIYWLTREPAVVALARTDGSERWRTALRDPWEPHLFAGEGSAFVSTGTNGRIPWTFAPETGDVVGDEPEPGHDFPAERFALDGTVYAVDPFFGVVHGDDWSQGVAAIGTYALSGGGDRVYYLADSGDEPGLYALSRTDGTVEWATDAVTAVVGRPVVADGSVLVRGQDALHCFDPAGGTERWSRPGDDVGTRFVVADDIVFTTRDGAIRAFRSP